MLSCQTKKHPGQRFHQTPPFMLPPSSSTLSLSSLSRHDTLVLLRLLYPSSTPLNVSSSSHPSPAKSDMSSTTTRRSCPQVSSPSSAASNPSLPSDSVKDTRTSEASQVNVNPQNAKPPARDYTRG